jgi:putative SOS response-associated peptidase YedK
MRPVHDRMPAILVPEHWKEWLDPANHDIEALGRLLDGGPADLLEMHEVSTDVNNVRNNRPDLTDPVSR